MTVLRLRLKQLYITMSNLLSALKYSPEDNRSINTLTLDGQHVFPSATVTILTSSNKVITIIIISLLL